MFRRYLLALFSILTVFLVVGCGQESIEPIKDSVQQEENKADEKTSNEIKEPIKEPQHALSELKVHFINVGQADSTLLQYSQDGEEYTILIDAGDWRGNNVVNYLNAQNISEIDIAIGTHPDADHIGQLDKVLNSFKVGEVWLSGNTSTSKTFQRLLSAIDSNGVDYYEPRQGDEFEVGSLDVEVLYPKTISENDNGESISLKFTYGEVRFIFTGDANTSDELTMLKSGMDMGADILQLGHHGSSTSTHPSFLKEVNPSIAIYSAGIDNSYGHPHDEVVNLIRNSGIQLYGTDVHGTVIVTTDGTNFKVSTKKDGTVSPGDDREPVSGDSTNKQGSTSEPDTKSSKSGCIDVNSASLEQLQEIIHIGSARAEDLIQLRPFSSVNELSRISGIGPARIEDIKSQGLACIGG